MIDMFRPEYKKIKTPEQRVADRIKHFDEVAVGYSEEQALAEASRCLQCYLPRCIEGCPVGVDIPEFIKLIKKKDYQKAADKIREKNSLPAMCGRVCPQETQCAEKCRNVLEAPVNIGALERFIADWELERGLKTPQKEAPTGKKIAVIGSGPAGLTCAADLAKKGHEVTIYEIFHKPGGVLVYGIPQFRLPKEIVQQEVDYVKSLGVNIETNTIVGQTIYVDELLEEYDAVFMGTGAGLPAFLGLEGENLAGIYSANEYLIRINLMGAYKFPEYHTPIKVGKKVAVIGGGNVAMDAARCALRLGAEDVSIIYRRSENEMPARKEEIERAQEEDIKFLTLTNPVRFIGENSVEKVELMEMELGKPDASGRRKPHPIEGSNFTIDVDQVVIAIGQKPHPMAMKTTPHLEIDERRGTIIVNDTGKTSREKVYAGGDVTTGAATVISAMGAGQRAAKAIDEILK